jgi:hypothetical protein
MLLFSYFDELQFQWSLISNQLEKHGFAIEDVFGFEYTMFVGDSTHSVTSKSWNFHTQGLDMEY